ATTEHMAALADVGVGVTIGQVVRLTEAKDLTPAGWLAGFGHGWGEMPTDTPPAAVIAEVFGSETADLLISRGQRAWTIPWQAALAGPAESADGLVRVRLAHPLLAHLKVTVVDA